MTKDKIGEMIATSLREVGVNESVQVPFRVMVCLSATDQWYGRLIRWATRSRVNHAFVAFKMDEFKQWMAIQIDERGVVITTLKDVLDETVYVDGFTCERDLWAGVLKQMRMFGWRYDWLGVVGFAWKILLYRLFRVDIRNAMQQKAALFCSEFVSQILKNVGEDLGRPEEVTPMMILQALSLHVLRNEGWTHSVTAHDRKAVKVLAEMM